MRLVIVTGMSGAGKATALKTLEDIGFYCVDNLPVSLVETFAQLTLNGGSDMTDVALGIDIRSGKDLPHLEVVFKKWRENAYPFSILFLDCIDEVLVQRFKETRRSHPLSRTGRIETGIVLERDRLAFIKEYADDIIDTSNLLTREFRKELEKRFRREREKGGLFVTVLSFGFRNGLPEDADLVFDARFLPNPYYIESLRFRTGLEKEVQEYVMKDGMGEEYLKRIVDFLDFLLPRYEAEGKTQLVIAVGCTGGHHRSVTIAEKIFADLSVKGRYEVRLEHRDVWKDGGK